MFTKSGCYLSSIEPGRFQKKGNEFLYHFPNTMTSFLHQLARKKFAFSLLINQDRNLQLQNKMRAIIKKTQKVVAVFLMSQKKEVKKY